MPQGLGIKTVKELYEETHALNHTAMRLKGDKTVNAALDNAIARESQLVRKRSSVVRAEKTHTMALNVLYPDGEAPSFPNDTQHKENSKVLGAVKCKVKLLISASTLQANTSHLDSLFKQGEFLKLAQKEEKDPIWKGFIWSMKSGTAKFLLNSTIHTLPTMNNLRLLNKSVLDQSLLCKNRDSTLHILNGCKLMLDQGRYTYRHDSILYFIVSKIDKTKFTVYSDINGYQTTNGGTVPVTMAVTELKPDIVIVNDKEKTVEIFELTVPFESNIKARNIYKSNKYAHFSRDITSHKTTVTAFEVGARGYLTVENGKRLKKLCSFCEKGTKSKEFLESISKIAITCSYLIYTARKQPTWTSPTYMTN